MARAMKYGASLFASLAKTDADVRSDVVSFDCGTSNFPSRPAVSNPMTDAVLRISRTRRRSATRAAVIERPAPRLADILDTAC
jgi:hypothetical protein